METTLAIALILAGVALAIFVSYRIWRYIANRIEDHRAAEQAELDRQILATRKWREERAEQRKKADEARKYFASKNAPSVPPRGKETTVTYAPSPTQSVKSDDGFVNGMLTGMLVDNLLNSIPHKSGGSSPIDFPKEERSPSVSKTESSWGFDDADSRKSASSSFSSSDSGSSWSSSDSSSSSPSSDW